MTKKRKKPRGKPKGGAYERKIAAVIAKAFCKFGINPEDCYRTSRGSKKGDLVFSTALDKLLPYTVECKHYKKVSFYHFFVRYEKMKKSWKFKKWWEQLEAEIAITKKKGLLVFRENNGQDLCAFRAGSLSDVLFKKFEHGSKITVLRTSGTLWIIPLRKFLKAIASTSKR